MITSLTSLILKKNDKEIETKEKEKNSFFLRLSETRRNFTVFK